MTRLTIESNGSGRLWTDDPAAWDALCTGNGCPMCGEDPHPEWLLAQTETVRVSAWPEAVLPGYACVLSNTHVVEPFELPESEQAAFFLDAMAAARGLALLLSPVKMNYEIHGNTVPHLHMHLFPRMPGDVYVGYPNHCRATFTRSEEDIERMRSAVSSQLPRRISGR
jgi:diadenosine tetraphosphate (Ap4A) HIT family hydrolase